MLGNTLLTKQVVYFLKIFLRRYYKILKGIVCINSPAIEHYKQYNKTYFIPNIIGEPFENQEKSILKTKKILFFICRKVDREKCNCSFRNFQKANVSKDWKLQIIGDGKTKNKFENL